MELELDPPLRIIKQEFDPESAAQKFVEESVLFFGLRTEKAQGGKYWSKEYAKWLAGWIEVERDICPDCGGQGTVPIILLGMYAHPMDKPCGKCKGTGKYKWVEKTQRIFTLMRKVKEGEGR